jgi:5-methylcytosine-specific restriction endonuclease McrA
MKKMCIGDRRHSLTILADTGCRSFKNIIYRCVCDCGKETTATANDMNSGKKKSCGCKRIKLQPTEAGLRELYRSYRRDAKHRGLPFELSLEEFRALSTGVCVYCGDTCTQTKFARSHKMTGPGYLASEFKYTGVDRSDNACGYTIANSVPCCGPCNKLKHTKTVKEFDEWIRKIYHHRLSKSS